MSSKRALLRWHGGKKIQASWIVQHLPSHQVYVEPYAGAASVLMRKLPALVEVLADLDLDLEDVYYALRDPYIVAELAQLMRQTPFASETLWAACKLSLSKDPVVLALRAFIRSAMARSAERRLHTQPSFRIGGVSATGRTRDPAADWLSYPDALEHFHRRLQHVRFLRRDACAVMEAYDSIDTLHYCDPPYVLSTRDAANRGYRNEMTDGDHERLLDCLTSLSGMVVLSGYPSELYDRRLAGWKRVMHPKAYDSAGKKRDEVLWINPAADAAGGLLAAAA